MGKKQKVYLSLGSNLGNRLANLQKAIFRIQQKVGSILDISSVYENPAIGFEGDQFLNIVISVLTPLSPTELLDTLLQIEQYFGRVRSEDGGYSSRTLDIDIIYYGSEIINNDDLVIPHPQMQHRNFVLKPLGDIAPQFYHPVLHKDTRNLLQECKDRSKLTKTKHKLFKDRSGLFSQLQLIAIEGNIGAGKTTLSKMEMSFLADRYQQFMDDTSQFDLFKNFMVSDYDIFKSLIFAKVTLQKEEYNLYRKVFSFMYKEVKKPEIYLYLYQNTERLLANIKKRGRDYEQNIDPVYLEKINRGYLDFIKSHPNQNSIILDMGELDFVHNPNDYEFILEKLEDNILLSNI